MKLTRRELAIAAAGAAAIASQAESAAQTAPDDAMKTVRATNERNSDLLAKFEIPIATEPAFQFKA
jgi:hypothetical protein